jgi:8-oxo-dGTP pyrophosphatase MutT (NUDIX family)
MNQRIAVRGIIFHDGKLLCAKLKPYKELFTTGDFWCTIGGGLDSGEDVLDGLKREVIEETGIVPQIGSLLYIQQYMMNDVDVLELFFHITNPTAYLNIDLSKTSHGNTEIAQIDFVEPSSNVILPKFLTTEPIDAQISSGITKIFGHHI